MLANKLDEDFPPPGNPKQSSFGSRIESTNPEASAISVSLSCFWTGRHSSIKMLSHKTYVVH